MNKWLLFIHLLGKCYIIIRCIQDSENRIKQGQPYSRKPNHIAMRLAHKQIPGIRTSGIIEKMNNYPCSPKSRLSFRLRQHIRCFSTVVIKHHGPGNLLKKVLSEAAGGCSFVSSHSDQQGSSWRLASFSCGSWMASHGLRLLSLYISGFPAWLYSALP